MTVENTSNRIQEAGNGVKVAFTFDFEIFLITDIIVYKVTISSGVSTLQVLNTDYTADINTVTDGGTVTYTSAPLSTEESLIIREVPLTQSTSYPVESNLPEKTFENSLDKLTMETQQLQEQLDRSIKLPVSSDVTDISLPIPEAGKALKWNTGEDGFENSTYDPDEQATLAAISASDAASSESAAASSAGSASSSVSASASSANASANSAVDAADSAEEAALNVGTFENAEVDIKTNNYTILTADSGKLMTMNSSTTKAFTLLASPVNGSIAMIKNIGSTDCTITPNGGQTTETTNLETDESVILSYDLTNTKWRQIAKHDRLTDGLIRGNNGIGINLVEDNGLAIVKATFYANYAENVNGTFGDGVLTGTIVNGASVSGGELVLDQDDVRYVEYAALDNRGGTQTGTIRFRVKPNYTGSPSTNKTFYSEAKANNDTTNAIAIQHTNGGDLIVAIKDSSDASIFSTAFAAWSPTAGVTYEIELNYDITTGASRLFVDGVQQGSVDTSTGTRDSNIGIIRVGSNPAANHTSDFNIDKIIIFNTMQHTLNYTPDDTELTQSGKLALNENIAGFSGVETDTNGIVTMPNQSGCRVRSGGQIDLVSGSATKVQFAVKQWDKQNEFDSSTNHRFTIIQSGRYSIVTQVRFVAVSNMDMNIQIRKNGVWIVDWWDENADLTTNQQATIRVSDISDFDTNDYIEIFITHYKGTNWNIQGGIETFLAIAKIA